MTEIIAPPPPNVYRDNSRFSCFERAGSHRAPRGAFTRGDCETARRARTEHRRYDAHHPHGLTPDGRRHPHTRAGSPWTAPQTTLTQHAATGMRSLTAFHHRTIEAPARALPGTAARLHQNDPARWP
ncbi:hypothetical protein GCM10010420_54910 [Streptomyces glaucosporus]|uniref:Uncharacterized protein n=1 Tax=Streptomyces glaucosporus TaxID=284044 RepID=A0ABP5W5B2_9ACTN